jgi:hypothetical protein
MWQIFALVVGAAWLFNRQNTGGVGIVANNNPVTDNRPFFASTPSTAGSRGSGQTNPLAAIFGSLAGAFGNPGYVPLSGPGGATTSPGASPSPSGVASNSLLPAAPGTPGTPTPIIGDVASLSDPRYWWMQPAVDVAIMSEDVSSAMALAGQSGSDLSPSIVEASIGMVL